MKTRDRILEACRLLFNERDARDVTTAEIAHSVGIAEGNVHYYFHYKEQMVTALFDAYEIEIARFEMGTQAYATAESRLAYISRWLHLMWSWRFAYSAGTYRMSSDLRYRRFRITSAGQHQLRAFLDRLREAGVLIASDAIAELLLVNAWIVMSYWLEYLRISHPDETVSEEVIARGAAQVEALLAAHIHKRRAPGWLSPSAGGDGHHEQPA